MLAAVNIAAYFLMWKDKVRAVRHGWRISENTFFLLSLLGGFIGVYCGMKRFHHKLNISVLNLLLCLVRLFG